MYDGVVDYYFKKCPKFVELLDSIRSQYPPERYQALAIYVATSVKAPTHELGSIVQYLLIGENALDWHLKKVNLVEGKDIDFSDGDTRAVFLNLMPDATKNDVLSFVEANWQEIKQALDRSHPNRRRKTVEIRRINDWLQIAEKVYLYKKKGEFNKEDFYSDLAHDFGVTSTEVKAHAKHYRPLMKLKYPSFKPDENSGDMPYSESYEGDRKQ
jgi:hypothetical protein